MPVIHTRALLTGNLEGAGHGATISLILDHPEPGHGPRLHKHSYDERMTAGTRLCRHATNRHSEQRDAFGGQREYGVRGG
jgi:hypothetical protein